MPLISQYASKPLVPLEASPPPPPPPNHFLRTIFWMLGGFGLAGALLVAALAFGFGDRLVKVTEVAVVQQTLPADTLSQLSGTVSGLAVSTGHAVGGKLEVVGDGNFTGNITAANFTGNGSGLTNLPVQAGPAGAPGATGPAGATGATGAQGPTGNSCGTGTCVSLQGSTPGVTETGNINISGTGTVGNLAVTAGGSVLLAGAASFPIGPTEGQIFYRTDTDQLYVYTGGKWQADRSAATKIVAANDSQNKEKADYMADGSDDQTEINAALSALPSGGGVVYLLEGTYTISGAVTVPSNTTLAGSGPSTIIKIRDGHNASINAIQNSDQTNGNSRITIRDLRLDGNRANQTTGAMDGIDGERVGSGTSAANAVPGFTIENVIIESFRNYPINLDHLPAEAINSVIRNSKIYSNGLSAIYLESSLGFVTIEGNHIRGNGGNGVYCEIIGSLNISHNVIDGNGGDGIGTDDCLGIIITGNTIQNNGFNGLGLYDGLLNAVVSGNYIAGNGAHGIEINFGNDNSLISNNTFYDNGGSGANDSIRIVTGSGSVITGNRITDTAGTGYAINIAASSSGVYLADNLYSGTGATSINDLGTGTIYGGQLTGNDFILQQAAGVGIGTLTPGAKLEIKANGGGTQQALIVNNATSTGNIFVAQDNGTPVFTVADGGAVTLQNTTNSTAALVVKNQAGINQLAVDTTNGKIITGVPIEATPGANKLFFANNVVSAQELVSGSFTGGPTSTYVIGQYGSDAGQLLAGIYHSSFGFYGARQVDTLFHEYGLMFNTADGLVGGGTGLTYRDGEINITTYGEQFAQFNGSNGSLDFVIATPVIKTITCSTTGGSLSAGTYYFKVAAEGNGGVTGVSAEKSCTISSGTTGSVALTYGGTFGADSFRIYKGTSSNGQDRYFADGFSPYTYTTDTGATLGTPSANASQIKTRVNGFGHSYFQGGNLSIGTASSDARLEVLQSSSNTTAGTLKGGELTVTDTGVVTTGTDTTYGQRLVVTRTGATGGTINTTGLDIQATGDTGGTSTVIGLNVNVSGADTNYAAVFQGGNVGVGESAPGAKLQVNSGTAGGIGQIIRGTVSQTGDLLQFQSNTGTLLARISSDGSLVGPALKIGTPVGGDPLPGILNGIIAALNAPAFVIRGSAGHTADLFALQNSGGTNLAGFNAGGALYAGANAVIANTTAYLNAGAAANVSLVLRGASGQTGDLQQWQNDPGTVLARVDANGNFGIGATTPSGNLDVRQRANGDSVIFARRNTDTAPTGNFLLLQNAAGAELAKIDIEGKLTVKDTVVNGTLTVNGHIVTGNTSGSTTVAANANCGTGCTVSIVGNDTSGTITINTGTSPAAGTQATVTFAAAYGAAPRVVITPETVPAASTFPQVHYSSATTTFDLKSYTALSASQTYKFTYHAEQ